MPRYQIQTTRTDVPTWTTFEAEPSYRDAMRTLTDLRNAPLEPSSRYRVLDTVTGNVAA